MKINIYHGSEKVIKVPQFGFGTTANDYGRGFYCTESKELAKEWACKNASNGFANCYELDNQGLNICNLNSEEYHILHWLALLTRYRGYWQKHSIAEEAKEYLQENYLLDISGYDILIGYRADDSYFSFAQDFIMGTISLQVLAEAMQLGKLGEQIVLKSKQAFDQIRYIGNEPAEVEQYYVKKTQRDLEARRVYAKSKTKSSIKTDILISDIVRGRVSDGELRL